MPVLACPFKLQIAYVVVSKSYKNNIKRYKNVLKSSIRLKTTIYTSKFLNDFQCTILSTICQWLPIKLQKAPILMQKMFFFLRQFSAMLVSTPQSWALQYLNGCWFLQLPQTEYEKNLKMFLMLEVNQYQWSFHRIR